MPVFDIMDELINPSCFAEKLVSAMCEVTFILKHYSIVGHRKDSSYVEANDVFSAQVETVAILKNLPVLAHSPYKGCLLRRPQHRPQVLTRREQINAAEVFVPQPASSSRQPKAPSLIAHILTTVSKLANMSTTESTSVDAATSTKITTGDIELGGNVT
jgi:hypothetical protein